MLVPSCHDNESVENAVFTPKNKQCHYRFCVSACIVNRTLFILQVAALTKMYALLNRRGVVEVRAQVEESRT